MGIGARMRVLIVSSLRVYTSNALQTIDQVVQTLTPHRGQKDFQTGKGKLGAPKEGPPNQQSELIPDEPLPVTPRAPHDPAPHPRTQRCQGGMKAGAGGLQQAQQAQLQGLSKKGNEVGWVKQLRCFIS